MIEKDSHRVAAPAVGPLDVATAVGFLMYSASVTVTPVCLVILARELGFGLTAGGGLEAARSILILVTVVGSAFLAGRWGKAPSLGVSSLVVGVGMMVYSVAPTYGVVLLGLGLAGLGGGVIEGLINPLVQALHPKDSGRYLNAINAFWSVGVLITVLVTGDLLTRDVSWRLIVATLGGFSAFTGLLFLALAHKEPQNHKQNLATVLSHKWTVVRSPVFWVFFVMMFLAGAAEGGYTYWSASFLQLHYGTLPRAGGIATAFFALGMICGRFGSAYFVGQKGLRRLLLVSAGSGILVSAAVPWAPTPLIAFFLLFLAGLTVACFWPTLQSYAADRLPVDATVLFILLSCAGIPGFAFASWFMGLIGEHFGLRVSFVTLSGFFIGLFLILVLEKRVLDSRNS